MSDKNRGTVPGKSEEKICIRYRIKKGIQRSHRKKGEQRSKRSKIFKEYMLMNSDMHPQLGKNWILKFRVPFKIF